MDAEVWMAFGTDSKLCATLPRINNDVDGTVVELAAECSERAADTIKLLQTNGKALTLCELEIYVVEEDGSGSGSGNGK